MKVRVVKDHFCGTGWRAEPETLYLGGVGAAYVEKLEFVLPETWAGMAVTLHIEQESGTVPQPMLLDGNNNAPVDGRFTTARQGLWMLMATDGEGRREMTMPGKYVCYQTLENGEGTGADGPAMPLRYQYLQLVLEQEARAALEAQRAARYRQWVADRCAAKEHALLLEALSGMRYSDASAWDMIAQLKQRWNSPPPEQAEPVAVESTRLDSKELSIKVGESCPLKATVLPGSAPQTVEWMAEPEGIVQLRENTLTAVKGGTALLTAIAGGKLAQGAACVHQGGGVGQELQVGHGLVKGPGRLVHIGFGVVLPVGLGNGIGHTLKELGHCFHRFVFRIADQIAFFQHSLGVFCYFHRRSSSSSVSFRRPAEPPPCLCLP